MHIFLSDEDNYARSVIYPLTHTVLNVFGHAFLIKPAGETYLAQLLVYIH